MSTQSNRGSRATRRARISQRIFELVLFAMLGGVLFSSKIIMELIPYNVHLLGTLIMAYTIVFRWKALIPIYLYVFVNGLFAGFALWWWPYLYIWTVLWGITMLLPRHMPRKVARIVYPLICALHGFGFGILYAPGQALMFHLNWQGMLSWIAAGLYFDIIHGCSNFAMGFLVMPLSDLLDRLMRTFRRTAAEPQTSTCPGNDELTPKE